MKAREKNRLRVAIQREEKQREKEREAMQGAQSPETDED